MRSVRANGLFMLVDCYFLLIHACGDETINWLIGAVCNICKSQRSSQTSSIHDISKTLLYPKTNVGDILDLVSSCRRRRSNFLVSAITQKIFFTFKSNLAQLFS